MQHSVTTSQSVYKSRVQTRGALNPATLAGKSSILIFDIQGRCTNFLFHWKHLYAQFFNYFLKPGEDPGEPCGTTYSPLCLPQKFFSTHPVFFNSQGTVVGRFYFFRVTGGDSFTVEAAATRTNAQLFERIFTHADCEACSACVLQSSFGKMMQIAPSPASGNL